MSMSTLLLSTSHFRNVPNVPWCTSFTETPSSFPLFPLIPPPSSRPPLCLRSRFVRSPLYSFSPLCSFVRALPLPVLPLVRSPCLHVLPFARSPFLFALPVCVCITSSDLLSSTHTLPHSAHPPSPAFARHLPATGNSLYRLAPCIPGHHHAL
jgi:hypothetical protein